MNGRLAGAYGSMSALLLYAVIVVSPLLLGSNRPIFWIMNSVLAGACLLLYAAADWRGRGRSRIAWRVPLLVACALAVSLLWMAVQSAGNLPSSLWHPVWADTAPDLPSEGAISLAPRLTLTAIAWAAPLAIFLTAFRRGTSLRAVHVLLRLMLAVTLAVAAFGMLVEAGELGTVGVTAKEYYQGWLTGTFVNRNTAACFFAIGACVALAMALDWTPETRMRRRTGRPANPWTWIASRNGMFAGAAGYLWLAVLLTGSRGGMIAGAAGAAGVLIAGLTRNGGPWRRVALFMVPLVLVALAAAAMLRRADDSVDSNITRLSLYREAIAAISDRPLLGHGSGAFEALQPLYHSATTPSHFIWNNAHSGVLELAVGNGIPGALIVIVTYIALLVHLARGASRGGGSRPAVLAGLGAMTVAGVHSLIDFSLETQAIALYVAILAGLGAGQCASRRLGMNNVVPQPLRGGRWPAG